MMLNVLTSFMSPIVLFWLVALIAFAIAEAATVGLVCIWFAGGALAALVSAGMGAPIWLQIALFLVVSAVLLALLRPMMRKVLLPKRTATNADRHVGQVTLVTEEINNLKETGAVKLNGVVWTARSQNNEVIPVGTLVAVSRIEGVKVLVTPAKQTAEL